MNLRLKMNEDKTMEEIYSYKENSFNIVRLLLAISVVYSHSFILYGSKKTDILVRITNGQIDFGSLAVNGFFIISGFLITQSMLNSKGYIDYLIKRCIRIFPAFLVSLLFCAFVIGPIVSSYSIQEYFFTNNILEPLNFVWKNITMNISGYSWGFHDVFVNNPFASSVNGSIWTLKHELGCYFIVMIFSFFYVFKNRSTLLVISIVTLLLAILNIKFGINVLNLNESYWLLGIAEYNSFIIFSCYFIMGSLIYIYKDKLKVNYRYLLLCTLLIMLGNKTSNLKIILLLVLPYFLISICLITNIKSVTKYGDFSYGIYIYSFPIQQLIVNYIGQNISLTTYIILSIIISFIFAVVSWRFIERPFLYLKKVEFKKCGNEQNSLTT